MKLFTVTLSLLVTSVPVLGNAQPNPFDDYESSKGNPTRPAQPPVTVAPKAEPAQVVVHTVATQNPVLLQTKEGRFNLGLRTELRWTTASNELIGGGNERNTNLFVRVAPTLGYFVLDNLEVSGSIGFLSQSLARGAAGTATETDWLLEGAAHYFLQVGERFALIPGLGIGGYVGSSGRPVTAMLDGETRTINEDTTTFGFLATLDLAAAYQLTSELQLRAGVAFTGLFGAESVPAASSNLSVQTFNTGLSLGLMYGF